MLHRLTIARAAFTNSVVAIAMAATAVLAQAHAIVVSSQPGAGAVVRQNETAVELQFNSRIDHRRSRLYLIRPDGTHSELAILGETRQNIVTAHAEGLTPGSYRIRWQVLSVDGHITRGEIPFSVAQ